MIRFINGIFVCLLWLMGIPAVDSAAEEPVTVKQTLRGERVVFGVLAKRDAAACQQEWGATVDYLNRSIPEVPFQLACLSFEDVNEAAKQNRVDFLVANPAIYTFLEVAFGASRVATMVNNVFGSYETEFGGVIFSRRDNKELEQIDDIKGKRIAAVDKSSFGGWLLQVYTLTENRSFVSRDLRNVFYTGNHNEVVYQVLNREADVGFVRTDTLERLQAKGELELEDLHIFTVAARPDNQFPFVLSTGLYPEWPLAKMSDTDEELTRDVVAALLNLPILVEKGDVPALPKWTFPLDYQLVRQCLKSLQVPPYEVVQMTVHDVVIAYIKPTLAVVFLLLTGIGLLVYYLALNSRLHQALALRNKELVEKLQTEEENTKLIEDLIQSERKFRSFFNSVNDAVLVHPFRANGFAPFIEVNRVACEKYGYSKEEFGELTAADITVPDEAREHASRNTRSKLLKEGSLIFETIHRSKDGKLFPVEISSNIVELQGEEMIIAIVRDRRERMKVENEKRRLATAIEQATEMVVITDVQGRIQYVNPAFCVNSGYDADEVLGRTPRFLAKGVNNNGFLRDMWPTLRNGEVWQGRIRYTRKDGVEMLIHMTVSPIKNPFDEITNFVSVQRDMTREASLEQQLQQAMKMEAIGTLAGGIAHDFNNILSVILGCSQLAQRRLDADHPVQDELKQIVTSGQRAADLVKQILTFSRRSAEELKPLRAQYVVKEALKLLRSTLPSTVQLREDIDMNCGAILADATKIHQVLMNLCTNAKDAMGQEGGVLHVTLSQHRHQPANGMLSGLKQGDYVVLEVRDTGCGMTAEMTEKIFEPFYTTKEVGAGTGLGLAVVHGIVETHGGQIKVASEPGKGTAFQVYLPSVEGLPLVEEKKEERGIVEGNEQILLVDDEPGIGRMMQLSLGMYGYKVSICQDGEEALEEFRQDPERYDLVITDMTMPKMTGLKLARELVAIKPDLPILLCTGYSEYVEGEDLKRSGVREFLLKPVDMVQLAGTIRKILATDS